MDKIIDELPLVQCTLLVAWLAECALAPPNQNTGGVKHLGQRALWEMKVGDEAESLTEVQIT